ncbi:MAG: right-handed parallel beta-helix repeat-containing protein [Planctomycetota bacterium]
MHARPIFSVVALSAILTLLLTAGICAAATELTFSRSGDDLTITAADATTGDPAWRLVLDETRGVITGFYDLTGAAGEGWNYVSAYGFSSGLFAPFGTGIRQGTWTYTPGTTADGQATYTYTLEKRFGTDDASYYLTTVTIFAPTVEGTVFSARTECYYDEAATIAQKNSVVMQLYAADEAQMNALFAGTAQGDLDIDGTLWSQVEVRDTTEAATLGLTPGRTFRVTGLNFTDGTLDYDGASVVHFSDPFGAVATAGGGIYNGWASKPPAGALFNVYTRMEINITGDAAIDNLPPVAVAGEDFSVIDIENDGIHDVQLDGSASYDDDGAILAWGWTLDGQPLATGPSPQVSLPVGINVITLTVTDDRNASDTDELVVTVEPRTPREFHVDTHHPNASDDNVGTDPDAPLATIGAAMDAALNGDTVTVHEGIYRERVGFNSSGTPEAPITLRAAPGERAVISGADALTEWAALPVELARGNPHHDRIYYADVPWRPARLYEDEVRLDAAREPNAGWWVLGAGSGGSALVDTDHLLDGDVDYTGARVFFRNLQPVGNSSHAITAYDPGAGRLTLADPLGDTATPGTDLYYVYNSLELIDTPGEWAVEQLDDTTWRVYLWPSDSADPAGHLIEATRRNGYLVSWGGHSHVIIDGLEIRGGQLVGINDSYALGSSSADGQHVEVRNCIVHDNEYMGVHIRDSSNITVRNCLIYRNAYGVAAGYTHDILIKNNEVFDNTVDGVLVTWNAANVTVEGNYVHDHVLWGHPDNCQTYRGPNNVWFIDNVMINAGQGIMMEETRDVHFVNNMIVGTHAYMLIIGHNNCHDVFLDGNTMVFSGYGLINNTAGVGRTFTNNIFYQGHGNAMYAATDAMNYISDHNIFYLGDGLTGRIIRYNDVWADWDTYLALSGQDAHSINADPQFVNAPKLYDAMDARDLPYFHADRVYMRNGTAGHAVGDHIEIDFDGVVRTITALGSDTHGGYIEYTPAHNAPLEIAGVVCNWKDNTDFLLDLSLAPTSPGRGAGEGGRDIGSTLDLVAYRRADFDGDGLRDVPALPGTTPQPLPGDADGDGDVDLDDFVRLKRNFGTGTTRAQGDFDGDGDVDLDDFVILKRNFGT